VGPDETCVTGRPSAPRPPRTWRAGSVEEGG